MARIRVDIDDVALRMTVQSILRADGHAIETEEWDVAIAGEAARSELLAQQGPALVLTPVTGVREAVAAMQRGVYGYVLTPLVPGEVNIMVHRALESAIATPLSPRADEPMTLAQAEMRHIRDTLHRCKHNQAKAARILGIGRNTLWRKLKRLENK
ncbi:MAG TPA: helix-turn-helix domain-containing protein [Candidatus Hydrogenedentes bacterium]|nr:helix-turn-helix domain-containing protein [Candidatus Hydrogenedentota bacterium]